MFLLFIKEIK